MNTEQIVKDCKDRMEKALDVLRNELKGLRTGRASPALLDALRVEYYGQQTPIKQLASVSAPEPQQLLIKPFDGGALKDIEKAIRSSDLGLAPDNDGKVIRLKIPPMSGARSIQPSVSRQMQIVRPTICGYCVRSNLAWQFSPSPT